MAWEIKQYKNGKYALWSTNVDMYVIGKTSKKEILDYLIYREKEDSKTRIRELKSTFPKGYIDRDTLKVIGLTK